MRACRVLDVWGGNFAHSISLRTLARKRLLLSALVTTLPGISFRSTVMDQKNQLDKFDLAILRALRRNARASLQELSKEVGLSSSPCWARIKRMEETGVIEGYTIKVSAERLGVPEQVFVQVSLSAHTDDAMHEFISHLQSIPEVLDAYIVSGDHDCILRMAVKGTRDYERLLREKLYKIPGLQHSKTSFVLRELKRCDLAF